MFLISVGMVCLCLSQLCFYYDGQGLKDLSDDRTTIGVKKLGEIDVKPFLNVCNQRFTGDEAMVQFAMLYSKWQHNINDLSWVPFKVLEDEDGTKVSFVFFFYSYISHYRLKFGFSFRFSFGLVFVPTLNRLIIPF